MPQQSELLTVALAAVEAAQVPIRKYFGSKDLEIFKKAGDSPVTLADREAETIIRETVLGRFTDHSFLGEEHGTVTNPTSRYKWFADPIDGTRYFTHGINLYGTLLGLTVDNKPYLGVMYIPGQNMLLYAEKGQGAFLNDQPIHVSQIANLADSTINVGSIKHVVNNHLIEPVVAISLAAGNVRALGNTYAQALLASGHVDAMFDRANTWDFMAAAAIIQEAGGTVTELNGDPFTGDSNSFLASNGLLHPLLLEYLNQR